MRNFVCDLCGVELIYDDGNTTKIKFGYILLGKFNFQDLCQGCGLWLLELLNDKKDKRLKNI